MSSDSVSFSNSENSNENQQINQNNDCQMVFEEQKTKKKNIKPTNLKGFDNFIENQFKSKQFVSQKIKESVARKALKYGRQLFKGRKKIYKLLNWNQIYLPKINSHATTIQYLMGIINKKNFCLQKSQIKKCNTKIKIKKCLLTIYLKMLIEKMGHQIILNYHQSPNYQWLINMIYTLNKNSVLFKQNNENINDVSQADLQIFFDLISNKQTFWGFFKIKRTNKQLQKMLIEYLRVQYYHYEFNWYKNLIEKQNTTLIRLLKIINQNYQNYLLLFSIKYNCNQFFKFKQSHYQIIKAEQLNKKLWQDHKWPLKKQFKFYSNDEELDSSEKVNQKLGIIIENDEKEQKKKEF